MTMTKSAALPSTRIIYLDFDGVLHPAGIRRHYQSGELSCDDGMPLFRWLPILERIIVGHNVQIVLSTSWVFAFGFDQTMTYLPESIASKVIGSTWHATEDSKKKYEYAGAFRCDQILNDAKLRGLHRNEWLAIDDDLDAVSGSLKSQFAACLPTKGISDPNTQECISTWLQSAAAQT